MKIAAKVSRVDPGGFVFVQLEPAERAQFDKSAALSLGFRALPSGEIGFIPKTIEEFKGYEVGQTTEIEIGSVGA